MHFEDTYTGQVTGHLTIHKRFPDGTEELVFDDHNVIVSGLSVGLSMFFTGSGSSKITDYHLDRFQIGVSGPPTGGDVSSIYELSGNLNTEAAYGGDAGSIFMSTNDQIKNGSVVADQIFALIPFSRVTRIDDVSVRYTMVLDEQAANDLTSGDTAGGGSDSVTISEIGLFMKNPLGDVGTPASILVAYRSFTGVSKTSDWALVFRWTINF